MESLLSQLPYQVIITDPTGKKFSYDVLLATFYLALDALKYANEVVNDYSYLDYEFVVTVKRNGSVIKRFFN